MKRKRELNSSLVVADHGIQPAETQSILVPGHHRNGQQIQHVQREELIPAAGWGGVCVLQGVGSSVAEGVVARACVRACVRAVWPLLNNGNVIQPEAERIAAEFAGWKQKHVVHARIQRVTCARV